MLNLKPKKESFPITPIRREHSTFSPSSNKPINHMGPLFRTTKPSSIITGPLPHFFFFWKLAPHHIGCSETQLSNSVNNLLLSYKPHDTSLSTFTSPFHKRIYVSLSCNKYILKDKTLSVIISDRCTCKNTFCIELLQNYK